MEKLKEITFIIVAAVASFVLINIVLSAGAYAQNNYIYIDQVGNNNQVTITQDGTGHVAAVAIGATLPVTINDLKTGYGIGTTPYNGVGTSEYNNVTISQQGVGSHTTTIELPRAGSNLITVDQSGASNHTFSVSSTANTNNINNTISATQSGTGEKSFALTLDGTNGATVTVQQTNPTQANTGAMTIQCTTCGSYSYIRN
jgi:Curlin associated repeat